MILYRRRWEKRDTKIKRNIFIGILFVLLLITGCTMNNETDGDQEIIDGFLKKYYSQLIMTSEEWGTIKSDIDQNMDKWKEESVEFLNEFEHFLTATCMKEMISNGLLPDFSMEQEDVEWVAIEDFAVINQEEGKYDVHYTLKIKRENGEEIFTNSQEINMVTMDGKGWIDSIAGDFVWK